MLYNIHDSMYYIIFCFYMYSVSNERLAFMKSLLGWGVLLDVLAPHIIVVLPAWFASFLRQEIRSQFDLLLPAF